MEDNNMRTWDGKFRTSHLSEKFDYFSGGANCANVDREPGITLIYSAFAFMAVYAGFVSLFSKQVCLNAMKKASQEMATQKCDVRHADLLTQDGGLYLAECKDASIKVVGSDRKHSYTVTPHGETESTLESNPGGRLKMSFDTTYFGFRVVGRLDTTSDTDLYDAKLSLLGVPVATMPARKMDVYNILGDIYTNVRGGALSVVHAGDRNVETISAKERAHFAKEEGMDFTFSEPAKKESRFAFSAPRS